MSRKEFMEQLEKLLMDVPLEERIEALAYYNGYFEDAGVENEEKIIWELESPEKVAKIIKADIGVQGNNQNPKKEQDNTLKIVLLVLAAIVTSPIWLGIAGGIAGVILGALGTILGILVAIAAVTLVFYVLGFVFFGVGIGFFVVGSFAAGSGLLGAGLLMLALAVLATVGCVWLFGRFIPWLIRSIVELCSRLFHRKESVA